MLMLTSNHLCRRVIGFVDATLLAVTLILAGGAAPRPILAAAAATPPANIDWPAYLGDKERSLYSPLSQINRSNVAQLKVAWTYDTGEKGEYQANNLIIAGALYTASPTRKVIALDAGTGRELWKWDAQSERPGAGGGRQRGLVFWQNETGGEQRLFTAVGNYLYALIRNPARRSEASAEWFHSSWYRPGCGGDAWRRPSTRRASLIRIF
jgi:quinoprotein glucose dehydrogenase